jgi:hypothetical protein
MNFTSMIRFCATALTLAVLLPLICGLGCKKDIPPPAALPADQFGATFDKAFAKAKPEAKELATQVVAAVQAQDYPKAFSQLQYLAATPGLNKEQRNVVASALLTVNELLAKAQSQGDQNAARTIQTYQRNR